MTNRLRAAASRQSCASATVHGLEPAAKRALLTWGDLQVGDRLVRAAVLGQVDDWGLKPWQPGDEGFHQLVVGLLYELVLRDPSFAEVAERWRPRPGPPGPPMTSPWSGPDRPGWPRPCTEPRRGWVCPAWRPWSGRGCSTAPPPPRPWP